MNQMYKPLRILIVLSLLFAFALPVSAASVTTDVYGDEETKLVIVQDIDVKVTAADNQITVSFPKNVNPDAVPDSFEISLGNNGVAAKVAIPFDSVKSDTVSHVFKNLKSDTVYGVIVIATKKGQQVGFGQGGAKTPFAKVPGAKATSGKGQITFSFEPLKSDPAPAYYEIYCGSKKEKTQKIVVQASEIKGKSKSVVFKNLKNGMTYSISIFAYNKNKKWLAYNQDVKATPKK